MHMHSPWDIASKKYEVLSKVILNISDKPSYQCKLVSAVWGFSKFDSPRTNSRRVQAPPVNFIKKNLFGDDACFVACNKATDVLGI